MDTNWSTTELKERQKRGEVDENLVDLYALNHTMKISLLLD